MASDDFHDRPSEPDTASPPGSSANANSQSGTSAQSKQVQPADAAEQPPPKPFYRRPVLMTVLVILVVAAIIGGVRLVACSSQYESTNDAFIDGHVVEIAPKVPGYVSRILVADNQMVDAGELLVEIDARLSSGFGRSPSGGGFGRRE